MPSPAVHGLASIIIPCWNQLEFTRQSIRALFRQTRTNWELIIINNGSTDGTGEYLSGVQDGSSGIPVTVIANPTNRGFPAAVNQGLQYARGEYLVLINNDVVITDGWLDQLIALTGAAPSAKAEDPEPKRKMKIGLVGPMSNYATPPQLVEQVPYRDMEEMKVFAQRWREEHRGQWLKVRKLSGFCVLMKREVYDAIGGLDERFGLGFFDDDDLAERARRAGFELAVARDLFVHHFGSRTFVGNGVDAERILNENAAKFEAKWGDAVPRGQRLALAPFGNGHPHRASASANSALRTDRMDSSGSAYPQTAYRANGSAESSTRAATSLTMIVKNEEANLPTCLESVRGLFDEIVVLDTGSKDRTAEIARSFGARVFDFVWVDDFAAARNAALARAKGDYAFWLDADDLIEPTERAKLETLLAQLRAGGTMPAFVVRCACDPGPDGERLWSPRANRTEVSKADLASSYPSKSQPLK
jgi:glycosyltransferase involved in cell wall biosynthesis